MSYSRVARQVSYELQAGILEYKTTVLVCAAILKDNYNLTDDIVPDPGILYKLGELWKKYTLSCHLL